MNDKLFNEVSVVGAKYNFGDWKHYAIHDDLRVHGFFGDYRWLSNYYASDVYFDGLRFPSSEHAYQAAKFEQQERWNFVHISASESKKLSKAGILGDYDYPGAGKLNPLYTSEEWDSIKYDVMSVIVFDKFYRNKGLRRMLLETRNKELVEKNHWNDVVYGVDYKTNTGKNLLGIILMNIRSFWKNKPLG